MDVCILQYKSSNHNYDSVWSNKDIAINQALFIVIETIIVLWKVPNCTPSQLRDAIEINNLIQQNNFEDALEYWNTCASNILSSSWFTFRPTIKNVETISSTLRSGMLNGIIGSVGATVAPITNNSPTGTSGSATTSAAKPVQYGAICRKCNQKNDYALADKPNGTYICKSCQMLIDVFSQ